jgi:hypothetical protein
MRKAVLVVVMAAFGLSIQAPVRATARTNQEPKFSLRTVAARVPVAEPSVQVDQTTAAGIHISTPSSGLTPVWSSANESSAFSAASTGQDGGDVEMATDSRGRLYEVELDSPSGASVLPVSVSVDHGRHFRLLTQLGQRQGPGFDRPWMTAWGNGELVVTATALGSSTTSDHDVAWRSEDGGRTWAGPFTVAPGVLAGPPLHASDGALYVAQGGRTTGVLWRSDDGGRTWARSEFSTAGANDFFGWPVLSQDRSGHLYCAWEIEQADPVYGFVLGSEVFLARSDDRGAHWTPRVQLNLAGHTGMDPWVVAGAEGRVEVSYYQARQTLVGPDGSSDFGTPTTVWDVELTQVSKAQTPHPVLGSTTVAAAVHRGSICVEGQECISPQTYGVGNVPGPLDRRFLDLFEMSLDPHGAAVVAFPHDRPAPPNILDASIDVMVAVQTSGIRMW